MDLVACIELKRQENQLYKQSIMRRTEELKILHEEIRSLSKEQFDKNNQLKTKTHEVDLHKMITTRNQQYNELYCEDIKYFEAVGQTLKTIFTGHK